MYFGRMIDVPETTFNPEDRNDVLHSPMDTVVQVADVCCV